MEPIARTKAARRIGTALVLAAALWGGPAHAQVTLGPEPRVGLPGIDVPAVRRLPAAPTVESLGRDARRLRLLEIARRHPERLDRDPSGELVVRGEILAQPSSREVLQQAVAAGYEVLRTREEAELELTVAVLAPPPGMSLPSALRKLRRMDPQGTYDFHHVYAESGDVARGETGAAASSANVAARTAHPHRVVVGMIDGGVAPSHEHFSGVHLETSGCDGAAVPSGHGTAVASLLTRAVRAAAGSAATLELHAVDVYCGDPTGGRVEQVVAALARLAGERVPVINVSLVGPRNALLELAVGRMVGRGHLLVAAVGNDGPAAPPLYPAAFEGVVGVTGIDARDRVLVEAGRGAAVDFAARGAEVDAAGLDGGVVSVRGTSFAAPVVAALLAARSPVLRPSDALAAVEELAARAIDLGRPGRDPVYGYGAVGIGPVAVSPSSAQRSSRSRAAGP